MTREALIAETVKLTSEDAFCYVCFNGKFGQCVGLILQPAQR
jgi:hypothetical protein